MTIDPAAVDVNREARELIAGLAREPWGQVSPSIYETGRLVSLAPWLTGHAERLTFLLRNQRPDGGWGAPGGYALVPTLSAVESLLMTLRRRLAGTEPRSSHVDPELAHAVHRGLQTLFDSLVFDAASIPDTPAVDLIVPALVAEINQHLDHVHRSPLAGLDQWSGAGRLGLPLGMDGTRLTAVQQRLAAGSVVPTKLLHAFEVVGTAARGAAGIRLPALGAVGASPAATAAWLGGSGTADLPGPTHADARLALPYLTAAVQQHGGPVPCATPITVFERGWVLSGLLRAGIPIRVPPALVDSLVNALGPTGAPAGPGLPEDADTTSVALCALTLLGVTVDPDCLWEYESGGLFCTWPGEDGFSVTTNAHVLDAIGQHLLTRPAATPRYLAAADRLSMGLRDRQEANGAWLDRWHASAYYATACCALALHEFGRGSSAAEAVTRAVDWILATQRSDGSWGRWTGTAEETAYALHVLLITAKTRVGVATAVHRGCGYLLSPAGQVDDPPLWHDKDLYRPVAIGRAAVLAALHLAQHRSYLVTSAQAAT